MLHCHCAPGFRRAAPPSPRPTRRTTLKLLAGTWKPKEASLGDNKIDMLLLDTVTLVYEAEKYTLTIGDKVEKGTYTLDPKKSPKAMDIFPTEGDNNGKTFLAVYKIDRRQADDLLLAQAHRPPRRF